MPRPRLLPVEDEPRREDPGPTTPAPRGDEGEDDDLDGDPAPISSVTEPPLAYLPLVFTIPKMLRPAFLFDRRLSGLLCRAAYAVVRDDFAARFSAAPFPHLDRPVPAFVAAPLFFERLCFGTLLTFHPHVHALVSSGVFDRDGMFHPIPADEATERLRALEHPFRDAVLDAFLRRGTIDDDRAALLRSWEHSGFSVHAERAIPAGDDGALTSILEYFARPAVSERRLTHLDTGLVHVQGTFHPGLGRDHQLWTGVKFLAHLVPHIQHRYECRIHTYGALSTSIRKRFGWIGRRPPIRLAGEDAAGRALDASARTLDDSLDSEDGIPGAHSPTATTPVFCVDPTAGSPPDAPSTRAGHEHRSPDDEPDPFTQARKRLWAELIRHVWLEDPEICEKFGARMRIAGVCTSPRDDDAIRQELEARGAWDPPWARAPPQSVAPTTGSGEPSDPSSPHLPPADSTHPEHDPWDDEWVPDPWADAEGAEDDPDIARADDLDDGARSAEVRAEAFAATRRSPVRMRTRTVRAAVSSGRWGMSGADTGADRCCAGPPTPRPGRRGACARMKPRSSGSPLSRTSRRPTQLLISPDLESRFPTGDRASLPVDSASGVPVAALPIWQFCNDSTPPSRSCETRESICTSLIFHIKSVSDRSLSFALLMGKDDDSGQPSQEGEKHDDLRSLHVRLSEV